MAFLNGLLGVGSQYFTHDHNAYSATTGNSIINGPTSGNIPGSSLPQPLDYLSGPAANWYGVEGGYYLPTSGGKLSQLTSPGGQGGSRTGGSAGLFHHTTAVSQTKEANSTVDIGFHYVATTGASSTTLVDSDFNSTYGFSDGAPDYWEDRNGDGLANNGELNFNVFDYSPFTSVLSLPTDSGWSVNQTTPPDVVPPDTMGAIGPSHWIQMLNETAGLVIWNRVFNPPGLTKHTRMSSYKQFFKVTHGDPTTIGTSPTVNGFDPQILFDHATRHWFACVLENTSKTPANNIDNDLFIAVSNSEDPIGTPLPPAPNNWENTLWKKYKFNVHVTGKSTDRPRIGIDANGFYVAVDYTPTPGTFDAQIFAFSKNDLINGAQFPAFQQSGVFQNRGGIQPAVSFETISPSEPEWVIREKPNGIQEMLSITWQSPTLPVFGTWADVVHANRSASTAPINAPQPSPSGAVIDALQHNGKTFPMAHVRNRVLWTCHTIGVDVSGMPSANLATRTAIEWLKFQLPASGFSAPTLQDWGYVFDSQASNPWYFFYPTLTVNLRGDVLVGFSGASAAPGGFVRAFYAGRIASLPGQKTYPWQMVPCQSQCASYSFPANENPPLSPNARFGDYSHTTLDPRDGLTFWSTQETADWIAPPSSTQSPWAVWTFAIQP